MALMLRKIRRGNLEREGAVTQDSLTSHRDRFAEALLGKPGETEWVIAEFGTMSAAGRSLCHSLEKQLGHFREAYFHRSLVNLNIALDPPSMEDLLSFGCSVIGILRSLDDRQRSIDDIVRDVYELYKVPTEERSAIQTDLLRQAIFALLGIFTMLYTPSTSPSASHLEMALSTPSSRHLRRQDLEQAGRPIHASLIAFGTPIPSRNFAGTTLPSTNLQVSLLNYASLSLDIAGRNIKIVWTDTISPHLDFDGDSKTLQVFRFPSLCAANYLRGTSSALFDW